MQIIDDFAKYTDAQQEGIMKKTYINPEMEIVEIKNNNIITTSTGQAVFGDDGWSEDIMLNGLNQ